MAKLISGCESAVILTSYLKYLSKIAPLKSAFEKHTWILLLQKMNFKVAITKIFFISASINAVKGKIDLTKA